MSESIGLEVEDVDLFQFVDVAFQIKARLIDTNTGITKTGQVSTIKVLLGFEGNSASDTRCREHHPHLLEVVSNTGIQENGTGLIEVKITDVSMNHEHQRFVVYLEAYRTHGDNNILLATTNPITSVRHKLVISESNTQPYIWYKDEGAKDKCIKVLVKLIDANKNVVKDRYVLLAASLVYSSGQTVQPLSVLSLFNEKEKPLMIGTNGNEMIKFRVNEVSRNHRKQLFHLLVTADIAQDPSLADISPATSIAFEVKSKRTPDARKEQMLSREGDEDNGDVMPLPQSRLSSVDKLQPLKRLKMDPIGIGGASIAAAVSSSLPSTMPMLSQSGSLMAAHGLPMRGAGATNSMDPNMARSMNELKAQMDNSLLVNGAMRPGGTMSIVGHPQSQQSMQSMQSMPQQQQQQYQPLNMANPSVRGGVMPTGSSGGMMSGIGVSREDIPEEVSYEVPFKAIYALAEWTNVAVNTLSAMNALINNIEDEQFNNADLHQSIAQLIETYPGRAHSCLDYLKQFLALQEQRALQQYQWMHKMQQDHQMYRHELDSLLRTNHSSGSSSANAQRPAPSANSMDRAAMPSRGSQQQPQAMTQPMPQAFSAPFSQPLSAGQQSQQSQQMLMRGVRVTTPSGSSSGSGKRATSGGPVPSIPQPASYPPPQSLLLQPNGGHMVQRPGSQLIPAVLSSMQGSSTTSSSRKRNADGSVTSASLSNEDLDTQLVVPESMVTNVVGKRVFIAPDSEQLGFPAFSTHFPSGIHLVGFYMDSGSDRDETGWKYRPLQHIDICNEPDLVKGICAEMILLLEDPANRTNGLCFDIFQYDGSLPAMKRSILMILHELEDNEVSITHYLGQQG